ncbi:MAG: HAMP domain-containing protein [Geobacter sp.]|nr:HAMP domain-containing protein [Geobacter sp.]
MSTDQEPRPPWRHSIRLQMVVAFSLVFCLVLAAIQLALLYGIPFTGFKGSVRSTISHEFEMLGSVADSRKQLIQNWLKGRRNNARVVAEIPTVKTDELRRDPMVRQQVSHWLEQLRATYQLESVRIIVPQTGRPVAAAQAPDYTGSELSQAQLNLAAAPGMDESLHLIPTPDQSSARLHIIRQVGQELTDDGSPLLLVEIECDLDILLKPELAEHDHGMLGKSGEILLVDAAGQFLTTPRYDLSAGTPVLPLQTVNRSKHVKLAVTGGEGALTTADYRGVPVLAAYRHIQITPEVAWGLLVEKDRSEVLAPIKYQRRTYLLLGMAGLLVTILLTILIAHRISRPLRSMVTVSRSISNGELGARAALAGQAEVVELAGSFNLMLDQLQQWHNELDQRVQERTAQLSSAIQELQREVTERTRAEELLHEKTIQLEEEIGERQKAQEALEQLNTTLEERIRQAIAELRTKDDLLIHQNRLAAMGELLTSIAHQWRQPLNNIAICIQTLQFLHQHQELTEEELNQQIETVMDLLTYMSHTIDDFRKFFREDREAQEFVLREVVERSLNLIRAALASSDIQVTVEGDESVRAVGHPNEYSHALMNILHNARDILLERKVSNPRIRIAIKSEEGHTVVTVQDNGGGIPDAILPQIFDPYFTTKGPAVGTGIGLYMARTLIERNMGGRLTARNVNGGAEFRVEL